MQASKSGNEKFYRDCIKAEIAVENAHKRLFRKHKDAFNRFFDLALEHGEEHVKKNFPELQKAVDIVYASSANLQKVKSDPQPRLDAVKESLVAEMKEIGSKDNSCVDPIIKLRSDFKLLSRFRSDYLDRVHINFWLFNALSTVAFHKKDSLSWSLISTWCEIQNIRPQTLEAALKIISPLWRKDSPTPEDCISAVLAKLDEYPFDIDKLLAEAKTWAESNLEVVEGVMTARTHQVELKSY